MATVDGTHQSRAAGFSLRDLSAAIGSSSTSVRAGSSEWRIPFRQRLGGMLIISLVVAVTSLVGDPCP